MPDPVGRNIDETVRPRSACVRLRRHHDNRRCQTWQGLRGRRRLHCRHLAVPRPDRPVRGSARYIRRRVPDRRLHAGSAGVHLGCRGAWQAGAGLCEHSRIRRLERRQGNTSQNGRASAHGDRIGHSGAQPDPDLKRTLPDLCRRRPRQRGRGGDGARRRPEGQPGRHGDDHQCRRRHHGKRRQRNADTRHHPKGVRPFHRL